MLASVLQDEAALLEVLKQALAHYQNKAYGAAKLLCAEVLAQAPSRSDALTLMGILYRKEDNFERAEQYYHEALKHSPTYADALNNLGNLARERGRLEEALAYYQKALALRPDWAEGFDHMGAVLHAMNRVEEAVVAFDQSLAIDPNYADAHWDRGLAMLALGRYREGWNEYAWRWKRRQPVPRDFPQPVWDGSSDIKGKRVLIYGEQGFGDVLQFLRFIPRIKALGATIILEVYDIVAPMIHKALGVDVVVVTGSPLPAFDLHIALLDIPRLLGIELADLPNSIPYIKVPADRHSHWQQCLQHHQGFKVGLVWAGNPNVKNDRWRSPRVTPLLPLLDVPGVTFFALQKGDGRRDLEGMAARDNFVDLGEELSDFADTAAVIAHMDLVISTDTSVVHLAGALGKPVWVLLHNSLDWRWTGDAGKAWYPSATLYRQRVLGEWSDVVDQVVVDLQNHIKGSSNNADTPRLVEQFVACPLCNSPHSKPVGTFACTRHALYHPPLPPTLTWKRCQACDHVYTDSYYTPAGLQELFSQAHTSQVAGGDLDQQRFIWSEVVERVIDVMDARTRIWNHTLRWLDVGCGNGGLLFTAQEFGFEATAIDVRSQTVEALIGLGYAAIQTTLEAFCTDQTYDVVSLADVLEHIPYPKTALVQVHKLLNPNGLVMISCPNSECVSWTVMDQTGQNPYWGEIEHHHNFSRTRLSQLLQAHGFEPVLYAVSKRYKACMEIIARKVDRAS